MTGKSGALQSKESPRNPKKTESVPWKRLKELSTINILIEGMRKRLGGFSQLQSAKRCLLKWLTLYSKVDFDNI